MAEAMLVEQPSKHRVAVLLDTQKRRQKVVDEVGRDS
jgi:hypothetical protein